MMVIVLSNHSNKMASGSILANATSHGHCLYSALFKMSMKNKPTTNLQVDNTLEKPYESTWLRLPLQNLLYSLPPTIVTWNL
jgi:hypothetical protein